MAAGETDGEEETLQTAFKKLRVDAESALGGGGAPESPRVATRVCADVGAVKSKLGGPKDNWHGCVRKTSRAASRTQRRRRSKSPILQAASFTYCSVAALAPPGGCLKQQRLATPTEPRPDSAATRKDIATPGALSPTSPAVFGSTPGYVSAVGAAVSSCVFLRREEECSKKGTVAESADFRALSKLHRCTCTLTDAVTERQDVSEPVAECLCRSKVDSWNGVEAYSFTGLRDVMSECEYQQAPPRTDCGDAALPSSCSPASHRSCSEQARVFVDDVTIEDLSGYMEFYLYIPKKMSHMAEMMYT